MPEAELPWVFTEPLDREQIPYMIVGAYAAIAFGVFRTTNDLDVVIAVGAAVAGRIERAFPKAGFYVPPRETLVEELSRSARGHFNIIHHATQAKMDCYPVGGDSLQLWGLKNRKGIDFEGRHVWIAPPEVVILKKLEFFLEGGSTKHLNDVRGILTVADVDLAFIEGHVARLGLQEPWLACQPP
jgi:hypothetical protein